MSISLNSQWELEAKRSLKVDELPPLKKFITGDATIFPLSIGTNKVPIQNGRVKDAEFLAIQNYSELVDGGMEEWIRHPRVGLRFRQLDDVTMDKKLEEKSLFLSQPFLFCPKGEQEDILNFVKTNGSRINMGWSPLSFGLTRGEILKKPLKGLNEVIESKLLQDDSVCWFYLSSAPYQWAGAEPHAELGILLSVVYEILKELTSYGMSLEASIKKISFGLALGSDVLIEPSKIVALKMLFQHLVQLLGGAQESATGVETFAMPSLRHYSGLQPWNNIMRSVLMCSSAIVGGARGFKCIPYDALHKSKRKDAIRISTNVPLLLCEEAHLNDVLNPLDGAPLFYEAANTLCWKAWDFFKEIEKKGGVLESVRSGWLQMQLQQSEEQTENEMKHLEKSLIGVNEYVDQRYSYDSEKRDNAILALEQIIDPLFLDKHDDEYMSVQPLTIASLSYDWEMLQQKVKLAGEESSVYIVKSPSPTTEKKVRKIVKVMSLLGLHYKMSEAIALQELSSHSLVLLIGDEQQESIWRTEMAQKTNILLMSFSIDEPEYQLADRIVQNMVSLQRGKK